MFNKIRICYLISSLDRQGPVNVIYNILKDIDYNKFDVLLIALKANTANSRSSEFRALPIEVKEVDNFSSMNIYKIFRYVSRILEVFSPQIIHAHCFRSLVISNLLKSKYNVVYTMHIFPGDQFEKIYGKVVGKLLAKMSIFFYKRTPNLIACSYSLQKEISEKLSIESYPIINGVASFNKIGEKALIRKRHNLNSSIKYFITVGRFSDEKNFKFLIESFQKPELSTYGLILLGEGDLYESLKNLSSDRIIMPGFVGDPSDYLSSADYYISSSKTEGMPMSVLEAMSHELPLILSDIPPHIEVIHSSENCIGFVFKNNDYLSLSEAIRSLEDYQLDALKRDLRQVFLSKYSSKTMSKNYQDFYLQRL